ncbi:MAG: hypothetical protein WCJ62_12870, partial [Flavobacterium sp.]
MAKYIATGESRNALSSIFKDEDLEDSTSIEREFRFRGYFNVDKGARGDFQLELLQTLESVLHIMYPNVEAKTYRVTRASFENASYRKI